jgi:hypothetical protein
MTTPSHIVVVQFENRDFNTVIGNPAAPFLNKLASEGMRFTNYDAVDHPSEPNYLALFQVRSRASAAVILYRQPCLQARRWRANSLTTLETQLRASAAARSLARRELE